MSQNHLTVNKQMYQQQLASDVRQVFDFYCDRMATDIHNIIVDVASINMADKSIKQAQNDFLQKNLSLTLDKINECLANHYEAALGQRMQPHKLKKLEVNG